MKQAFDTTTARLPAMVKKRQRSRYAAGQKASSLHERGSAVPPVVAEAEAALLPARAGVTIGRDERLVVIPRSMLIAAKRDIPGV
ncbi:hypothetical protein GCM10018790_78180 [Kitasatospora xanthocidica]|nr:hypothetical protein GCM10018790_78180 [Kitasatospora xanthocidica]